MKQIASKNHWRLVTLIKTGCPAAAVTSNGYSECAHWREAAIKRISEIRPTAVLIGNFSALKGLTDNTKKEVADEWYSGLQRTLQRLVFSTDFLLVLRDNPAPRIDVLNCLSRAAWHRSPLTGKCQFDRASHLSALAARVETEVVRAIPNASIIDLSDEHCPGAICESVQNGIIVYRDEHHLTRPYVLSVSPALERRILTIMGSRPEQRTPR